MKVAKKSPGPAPKASSRATLTLAAETYAKIDQLRGTQSRSSWVQGLVESEEGRRGREQLAQVLNQEYTAAVSRETLALNQEFPIHEE